MYSLISDHLELTDLVRGQFGLIGNMCTQVRVVCESDFDAAVELGEDDDLSLNPIK